MIKRLIYVQAILVLWAAAQAPKGPGGRKYGYGTEDALKWVNPDHSDLGDLKFKTFHSATIKGDVSYMIYFPPDYEQDKSARYPVLYQLPASGGTPRRDGPQVTGRIDKAIRAKRIGPMIIVVVNGLAGNTMYADTRDGQYPLESVIIKDLIPHIDATYRTIASREGRGVNGFSMGGFGAAHLGFKNPDVFGVDSIMAPPLVEPGLSGLPAQAWGRLFPSAMDSDMAVLEAQQPLRARGEERRQVARPHLHSHRGALGKRALAGAAVRKAAQDSGGQHDPARILFLREREVA